MYGNFIPFYGWAVFHCMYISDFIYLFILLDMGYLYLLAFVNNVTMNVGIQASVWIPVFHFIGYKARSGIALHCPEKFNRFIYIVIELNCLKLVHWNTLTCINALCPRIYILKIHTQMKMEKLPIPDFCPLFSICNHILRCLLNPWKKEI